MGPYVYSYNNFKLRREFTVCYCSLGYFWATFSNLMAIWSSSDDNPVMYWSLATQVLLNNCLSTISDVIYVQMYFKQNLSNKLKEYFLKMNHTE